MRTRLSDAGGEDQALTDGLDRGQGTLVGMKLSEYVIHVKTYGRMRNPNDLRDHGVAFSFGRPQQYLFFPFC